MDKYRAIFSWCRECEHQHILNDDPDNSIKPYDVCNMCIHEYYKHHDKGLFKPKQENNVKRIWKNCDHASLHKWNGFKCVYYGNGECNCRFDSDTGSRMFELRREYNPQNKEQKMSYKPTSSCTLKNIATKIHETGCSEAKSEFFDFLIETRDGYSCTVESCWNFEGNSELTRFLTKTEKRRNWLLKFGYIEEEISLLPCPFCGSEDSLFIPGSRYRDDKSQPKQYQVVCDFNRSGCGSCGVFKDTKQEAIKAWNTRKQ